MQTRAPEISIIIVSWNGKELLSRCLLALSMQTRRDFELVVVDNGSTDGTVEWLRKEHPMAIVVALESNRGFAGGNNAGLAAARGKTIVTLNNDMIPRPDWLEQLVAGFGQDDKIGICVGKYLFFDSQKLINSAGDLLLLDGQGKNRGFREIDKGQFERPIIVGAASAGATAYLKRMLDGTGFFDADYFAYYEDVDLSLRAIRRGWKCLYVPSAVTYHGHMSTTSRKGEDFLIFHTTRNKLWNIFKDYPGPLILPSMLYSLAGSLAFVMRHPHKRVALRAAARGVLEALAGIPRVLDRRIPSVLGARDFLRAMNPSKDECPA